MKARLSFKVPKTFSQWCFLEGLVKETACSIMFFWMQNHNGAIVASEYAYDNHGK
jgi:hypothetical protein